MEMSSQQSNSFGIGAGVSKKWSGGTRRVWSQREEKVLITALKDLVAKGQKMDNGFRTDYLSKLEDALRKAFTGTDLQETPNITSKITTWRRHYSSIVSAKMIATGVGFNTTPNQLECTNDLWEAIMKDRATGETAEEVPEAIGEIDGSNTNPIFNNTQESNDDNDFNGEGQFGVNKDPTQARDEQEENSASRKARGEFCKSTRERLEIIARRIGYDHDLGVTRK
ncbi:hypothetical protein ACS0TY_024709 [Phlomoides rotata]